MEQQGIILVTGCSGRVGESVIKRFSDKYTIVGFDLVPPKETLPNMEFVKVDLTSDDSVKEGLKYVKERYGDRILSVIHLAAYYSFSGAHPELYQKLTVQGTRRLLEGVQNFKTEQFLFSSTQLIYAPCPVGERINENSPILPKWDYPRSKVETENLMRKLRGDIKIVIMRIAGCYDNECHSIPIANQIQRIYEKQLIAHLYSGNFTHGSPFIHLDDLADAILLTVEKRDQLPQELDLLIGEDKTMSYEEMQNLISELIYGTGIKTIEIPKWFAKIGAWILDRVPLYKSMFIQPWMIDIADDNYTLDVSLANETLGWKPRRFVGNTLPLMVQNLRKNPAYWYETNGLIPPAKWIKF